MTTIENIQNLFKGHVYDNEFEVSYLKVREVEKRIYDDSIVMKLPQLDKSHVQFSEWNLRAKSTARFINYLESNPGLSVLEIGCGNGWFCNRISAFTKKTIGSDVNLPELKQAASLFENITFWHHDFQHDLTIPLLVDLIVFNASFQYFESAQKILGNIRDLLNSNGEVHIIDTPFYHRDELKKAIEDTNSYYQSNKVEEMSQFYHHHTWEELPNYKLMYKPKSKLARKFSPDMPFPWLYIKKADING